MLFASAHSIVDFSNGAAVATLDVLRALAAAGFDCQAFCTSRLDFREDVLLEKLIVQSGEPLKVRPSVCPSGHARLLHTRRHQVPITLVRLESSRQAIEQPEEVRTALDFFGTFLRGLPARRHAHLRRRSDHARHDRACKYAWHRHRLRDPQLRLHRPVGLSRRRLLHCTFQFACRYYRDRLGLNCQPLPNPVDWDRVTVEHREPRFVTFVNPLPEKGVYPFVRIVHELARRRPDIPFLVVESRGTRKNLVECGLGKDTKVNVQIMANTPDPRHFWRQTRIALLPSLWWENQPLVAIEAMINGIPVIGSNRGGIPETLGAAGICLPLPDRLTPATRIVPTAEEVEPWVQAVIRLWDDRAFYEEQSRLARQEALRRHPDRLRPLYAEFFGSVRCPAGPPRHVPV